VRYSLGTFRLKGIDINGDWTQHTCPHRDSKYFHNAELKLVTTEDIQNSDTRHRFLATYRQIAVGNQPHETCVYLQGTKLNVLVVDHAEQLASSGMNIGSWSQSVPFL
jgi:hypothetical protein